ncbi:MAG: hypothetical protein HY560_13125 [Gemmatimonadetes bacterium]|nr:hypothetical protein [Gemmatimonadota bacterium]
MVRIVSQSFSERRRPRPAGARWTASADGARDAVLPLVDRLARLDAGQHWVVSCYLKLEPRDRSRGKYLIKLKNRIRDRLAHLERRGLSRAERDALERDLGRVRQHLEDPVNLPTGRGIAVFACEPIGLFEAIPLPHVFRSRLAVDHSPLVRELTALADEFGTMLGAVYDRTGARFFQVTAFGVEELPGLTASAVTRGGRFRGPRAPTGRGTVIGSLGEHNYHGRIREEKQRHYAQIAQRLFDLSRPQPVRGLVLGGVGVDTAAVVPHLHPYLQKQVLGIVRLNPKEASLREVHEAVLEARRAAEREWEAQHVHQLEEGLGAGWATNGVEATLRALSRGQVRTLLVDPAQSFPGHRCSESGRLSTSAGGCRGEGEAEPVEDVIDDAIEEALRQRSHVDVVEDPRLSGRIDGLAALLRFKQG